MLGGPEIILHQQPEDKPSTHPPFPNQQWKRAPLTLGARSLDPSGFHSLGYWCRDRRRAKDKGGVASSECGHSQNFHWPIGVWLYVNVWPAHLFVALHFFSFFLIKKLSFTVKCTIFGFCTSSMINTFSLVLLQANAFWLTQKTKRKWWKSPRWGKHS